MVLSTFLFWEYTTSQHHPFQHDTVDKYPRLFDRRSLRIDHTPRHPRATTNTGIVDHLNVKGTERSSTSGSPIENLQFRNSNSPSHFIPGKRTIQDRAVINTSQRQSYPQPRVAYLHPTYSSRPGNFKEPGDESLGSHSIKNQKFIPISSRRTGNQIFKIQKPKFKLHPQVISMVQRESAEKLPGYQASVTLLGSQTFTRG